MPRTSSSSNPTGLKDIDRKDVRIAILDDGDTLAKITKLDLAGYSLPSDAELVCIARAGNTANRFEIGTVGCWKADPFPLVDLDRSAPLRFRVLVREPNSPRLIASCEHIRALGTADADSLIPMDPADLGEQVWKVQMLTDGPVLLFNPLVFPTAKAALQSQAFISLVMPEALRQVCRELAEHPEHLSEPTDPWYGWREWLQRLGVEPYEPEENAMDDEEEKANWCEGVVKAFASFFRFGTRLSAVMSKDAEND